MILPAILNPFVEGAPAAVMTRIALDWILDGIPLDRILPEVADGQFDRESLQSPDFERPDDLNNFHAENERFREPQDITARNRLGRICRPGIWRTHVR